MIKLDDALTHARQTARVFYRRCPQQHHDCILSVALEAGWKASVNYDPAKDTRHNCPRTYVTGRVMVALIDWWRKEHGRITPGEHQTNHKQAGEFGSVRRRYVFISLQHPTRNGDTYQDTLFAPQPDIDLLIDLRQAWRTLDTRQAQILRDRAIGIPANQTAARFGVHESRVSQIAKEAVQQLQLELAA